MTSLLPRDAAIPRYHELARVIQSRILDGRYAPGDRLPTEKDFSEEFDVSTMTVRQGIGLLVRRGMVERLQGRGMFVRKGRVAKGNVAIVFGTNLSHETAHFYRAMLGSLSSALHDRDWSFRCYDQIHPQVNADAVVSAQLESLKTDHINDPFGGLLVVSPPPGMELPYEVRQLPSSVFGCDGDVSIDSQDLGRQAVRELQVREARRLAFFLSTAAHQSPAPLVDTFRLEAAALGLPEPVVHLEKYQHGHGYAQEKCTFHSFERLMRDWDIRASVPDGLVFNDDIALRAAMPVLYARQAVTGTFPRLFSSSCAGVRVHHPLPVIRYENSPAKLAATMLHHLEKRMAGRKVEPVSLPGRVIAEESVP